MNYKLDRQYSNKKHITTSSKVVNYPPVKTAKEMAERILRRVSLASSSNIKNNIEFKEISNAHIDSCTYIGKGGLIFIDILCNILNGNVNVPTTLNSTSIDMYTNSSKTKSEKSNNNTNTNVPNTYNTNYSNYAKQLAQLYLKLGAKSTFTCAPYLKNSTTTTSSKNDNNKNIAWGESNAVMHANSALGLKTNKHPDFLDVCSSILGKVPKIGMHLSNNRLWNCIVNVKPLISSFDDVSVNANNNVNLAFGKTGQK